MRIWAIIVSSYDLKYTSNCIPLRHEFYSMNMQSFWSVLCYRIIDNALFVVSLAFFVPLFSFFCPQKTLIFYNSIQLTLTLTLMATEVKFETIYRFTHEQVPSSLPHNLSTSTTVAWTFDWMIKLFFVCQVLGYVRLRNGFNFVWLFLWNAEDADNELADFKEWFDYLAHKCSEPKVCLSITYMFGGIQIDLSISMFWLVFCRIYQMFWVVKDKRRKSWRF